MLVRGMSNTSLSGLTLPRIHPSHSCLFIFSSINCSEQDYFGHHLHILNPIVINSSESYRFSRSHRSMPSKVSQNIDDWRPSSDWRPPQLSLSVSPGALMYRSMSCVAALEWECPTAVGGRVEVRPPSGVRLRPPRIGDAVSGGGAERLAIDLWPPAGRLSRAVDEGTGGDRHRGQSSCRRNGTSVPPPPSQTTPTCCSPSTSPGDHHLSANYSSNRPRVSADGTARGGEG